MTGEPPAAELSSVTEEVATRGGGRAMVAAFEGDLDLASVGAFEEVTSAAGGAGDLVVDLSGVRFIDSSGIHAIVRARVASAERGAGMELVVLPGSPVERVLEISGLREELDPKPDRESSLAALDERDRAANGPPG